MSSFGFFGSMYRQENETTCELKSLLIGKRISLFFSILPKKFLPSRRKSSLETLCKFLCFPNPFCDKKVRCNSCGKRFLFEKGCWWNFPRKRKMVNVEKGKSWENFLCTTRIQVFLVLQLFAINEFCIFHEYELLQSLQNNISVKLRPIWI